MNETPETLEKKSTAIKMRVIRSDGSYELFDSKNECARFVAYVMFTQFQGNDFINLDDDRQFNSALRMYNRVRNWLSPCCNTKLRGSSRKFGVCRIEIV